MYLEKGEYKAISYLLGGLSFLMVLFACRGGPFLLVLAIGLGFAAYMVGQEASKAHAEERQNLEHEIQVKELGIRKGKLDDREKQLEEETKDELELAKLRRETEAKAERVRQEGFDLQSYLIDLGKKLGLLPEAVSAVNEQRYRAEIEVERRWKEITQDLDAGDLLDLADQQLIKKQTERLEEMYRRRYEIANGDDPPEVKEALLARYDKNIRHLEAKIDARQTGLLLPANGQETLRLGEGEADGT
jgi:hypothetical protein